MKKLYVPSPEQKESAKHGETLFPMQKYITKLDLVRRNESSAREGIDTVRTYRIDHSAIPGRNEPSAREGIKYMII